MSEIHIASCVMHVRPERVAEIADAIRAQRLAEIPAFDPRGRVVVVLERAGAALVLDTIERLRALPGVIAVNLVYQHAEDEQALEERMS